MKKHLIIAFLIVSGLSFLYGAGQKDASASLDKYPSKPIQIVVPASPGGDTDTTARFIAKEMEKELGQPIPIINMAGAAGTIAGNDVRNAPKDGYKVLYFHTDIIVSNLLGVSPNKWDEAFDIAAIPTSVSDFGLFTHKDAPFNTLAELVAYSKSSNEKKLAYATDTGSINQVLGRVLQQKAGIKFTEIDAGNASERVAALKGKQIDLVSLPYSVAKGYVDNGDFKCLGIMAENRNPFIPDVPTFKEQGFDITFTKFFFFGFPKGTPQPIIAKFASTVEKVINREEYVKALNRYNMTPKFLGPDAAREFMRKQEQEYKVYVDMMLGVK